MSWSKINDKLHQIKTFVYDKCSYECILTAIFFVAIIRTVIDSEKENKHRNQLKWAMFCNQNSINQQIVCVFCPKEDVLACLHGNQSTYPSQTHAVSVKQWPFLQVKPLHLSFNVSQPTFSSLPSKQCLVPSQTSSSGRQTPSLTHLNSSLVHAVTSWWGT